MMIFYIVEGVFYMAQWEEYHTGTLNWSNGYVGVTESQFLQMGLFLGSACFGARVLRFWCRKNEKMKEKNEAPPALRLAHKV